MKKRRIIFLNGVTSLGKTSIVNEYLREDYWKYLSEVIMMMYRTAKLFSGCRKDVLIDGILVERPEIQPRLKIGIYY